MGEEGRGDRRSADPKTAKTVIKEQDKAISNEIERNLRALKTLPQVVANELTSCRDRICFHFNSVCREWFETGEGTSFVAVHGNSKTVRHGLLVPPDVGNRPLYHDTRVFLVLSTAEQGDARASAAAGAQNIDARMFEYELKARDRSMTIATGTLRVLEGLSKKGDRIVLVLGAECFDQRGTVVHSRGMAKRIRRFRKKLGKRKVKIVVVAEEYKKLDSLLVETEFFDDHYDRVDVYHARDIDAIVTDSEVYEVTGDGLEPRSRGGS